jgi:hypothetical protein
LSLLESSKDEFIKKDQQIKLVPKILSGLALGASIPPLRKARKVYTCQSFA